MADADFTEFLRNWPCAACATADKLCTADCIFSPLFPPDRTSEFVMVHKVFGEMNSRKLLTKLPPEHRKDAADSLVYEAEARLRDPLNGCMGIISSLQKRLDGLKEEFAAAKAEIAHYAAMVPEMSESAEDLLSDDDSIDGNCVRGENMMADLAQIRALTLESFKSAADHLYNGNGDGNKDTGKSLMDRIADIGHYVAMMPGTSMIPETSMTPGTSKAAEDHSSNENGNGNGDSDRGKNKV